MSLGVVVKGPEGLVLAADSRVTLEAQGPGMAHPLPVNFDNATKLLSFREPHSFVGAVTYGAAVIGLRTAHSFLPELEQTLEGIPRLTVQDYAKKIAQFFMNQWQKSQPMPPEYKGPPMTFIVGGYDPQGAYGRVFLLQVPSAPEPVEQNPGETNFGMSWGGQLQVATRLIHGFDPMLPNILKKELQDDKKTAKVMQTLKDNLQFSIPYQVLPLQDCIDLATFLVRATMIAQDLAVGVRGVGGVIEVAAITRTDVLKYLQRKVPKVQSALRA